MRQASWVAAQSMLIERTPICIFHSLGSWEGCGESGSVMGRACEPRLVALAAGATQDQHARGLVVLQLRLRHHRSHLVRHLQSGLWWFWVCIVESLSTGCKSTKVPAHSLQARYEC